MFKQRLGLFIASLIFSFSAMAKTVEDFQTWGNITATGDLGFLSPSLKKFKYWMEGQGRFGDDTSRFSQGIIRPGLGYAINDNWSVWLGYAWVPTQQPFTKTNFDENRIWQQLLYTRKFSNVSFTSRSRIEQRFVPLGQDVGWRFRQLLKASVPFPFADSFSFVISDEYFVNVNQTDWNGNMDDGFNQNRAFAGIGYNFNKNIKTEIGYMNQYIRNPTSPDRMDNNLSVNLYLNY